MQTLAVSNANANANTAELIAADLIEQARTFADASQAKSTRVAYEGDLADFTTFCVAHGLCALPAAPQTVVAYITDRAAKHKLATIRRRLTGIANAHRERGLESPVAHEVVRRVLRGIARTIGAAQVKKDAITTTELGAVLLAIRGDDLKAKRDRAVLLLGFAGALRRSELAALDVADLHFSREGLRLTIRRSKTDQTGEGQEIAIPLLKTRALCAATAVREWLDASGITEGALFRSFTLSRQMQERRIGGRDVANLIKGLTGKAHLPGDFSGHSLRAGFVTSCARGGVSLDRISRVTRHRSLAVLSSYIRRANLFEDPALSSIVA